MKMEQIDCSETSVYKIQKPGNYPKQNIQFVYGFDVTSYISLLWGANTQERDVTAGSEKREKVTSPQDPIAQPARAARQLESCNRRRMFLF